MRVDELSASLPQVVEADVSVAEIIDVEHDSRLVRPGALFACCLLYTSDAADDP